MANAEDSEPLLGPNMDSSIWTVSPRSKGEASGMESQGGPEQSEIAENLSTPELHYGISGMMSPENSELNASLSSPHLHEDLPLQAVGSAQPQISSARLPHADTQVDGDASQATESSSQEMRPVTAPGQVNMPEAQPAPSAMVWPAETLAQMSGQGQTGQPEGAPLGMFLSTISSAASQESRRGESELSGDVDGDDDDDDDEEEEEEEEEEGEEQGGQQSYVHASPKERPSNHMANLLPGAKFSLPRMSRDNVPELLRSITPQHGVHFLPGLGGSHDSDRTPQTPSILAPSQSIASPPAVAGLRWSASVQSAASTDSGGISLLSALPSINVDLDDDTPIVNIRLQLKKGGREHYVSPSQMPEIGVDEELWLGSSSYVTELPPAMQNFRFLKTNWTDMHSAHPAYLDIKFHEQSKVYILMHSLLPVPDWLGERFEPDEHMTLGVDWKLDMIQNAIAYFGLKYDEMKKSRIKVWKLKGGFVAGGTHLKFPGLGAKSRLQLGFNYVVCWSTSLNDSPFLNNTKTRAREQQYSSKEQLNAALQEAVVMQDVIKADALLKQDADVNMTLTMSEYKGCLLTKVPAMAQNMPMLCCLVTHGAELDYHGLKYVLEYGHLLPVNHAPIQAFLCKYVRTTRNPANTCYAIAQALSVAAKEHTSKTTEYTALSEKFRRAAINLVEDLNKLSYIGGKERWMLRPDEVLEPTKTYSDHFPVNLASCSSTALKMHDTDYSATSTVQNFIQRAWVGVGFIQVARQAKEPQVHSSGITSNTYFLTLLTHYGFVGPLNRSLLIPVSQVAHVSLFAGRPFFDSPRGRWTYKILCHAIFLIVFHAAIFEPKPSERIDPTTSANQFGQAGASAWIPKASSARESYDSNAYTKLIALLLITIGMVVDLANVCIYQYGGSFVKFLSVESFSTKMDLMQLVMLVASTTLWGVMEIMCASSENAYSDDCKYGLQKESLNALKIMFSISAIVVWLQMLFILRPINKGLAPLLYVIGQMTKEVFVFLVPLSALLIGFAVALFSLFWGEIHEELGWTSIWSVVLLLFRFFVSDFQMSLDIFNPEKYDAVFEVDPVLQIYGVAVLVFFIILASILMANLLIAILTYKYDPETIDAESNFQRVMIVDDYQNQVDHSLVSSPFSLVVGASQLLCLPGGMHSKLKPEQFYRFLLPPLDDMSDGRLRPTGAKELPHFLFLITMMPVINALLAALLILAAPLCLAQFSWKTSKFLTRKLVSSLKSFITRRPAAGLLPAGISFFNRTTTTASSAFGMGNSVSRVNNTKLSGPPPRRNKMLKYMLSSFLQLCLLPFTASLGGVFYFVLLALLVLYTAYVWVAALCYSAFWCLHGFVRGLMSSLQASDGNSGQEEETGETSTKSAPKKSPSHARAGPSGKKKWGQLLAKQRKEEFKKIAFRSEEIDAALLLAGIPVPEAPPEAEDSKNSSSRKIKKPGDQADALEVEKERLNASIAEGKARMLAEEHHGRGGASAMSASMVKNKSNMSLTGQKGMLSSISRQTGQQQQGGLARGIARYDSRFPERGGRSNQPKPFAMNRAPSRSAGNPAAGGGLLEASGLINDMGGVRDDLAELRNMMEGMAVQMNNLQAQMMARSMAGAEYDLEASSVGDSLLETMENSTVTVRSAAH